jgi:signal transduction histidine kinase
VTSRLLIAAWAVALASAAASLALVLSSSHESDPAARAALIVGLGLVFVGCGLVAIVRRPENRIGVLMVIVGFFWFLTSLAEANRPTIFTVGLAVSLLIYGAFAHVILAFPSGRLETPLARAIVVLAYLDVTVVQWTLMLFRDHIGPSNLSCSDCPQNVFVVTPNHSAAVAVDNLQRGVGLALVWAAFVVLSRRLRNATPAARRTLLPVVLTSSAAIFLIAAQLITTSIDRSVAGTLNWFVLASFASVPAGFLVGLLRSRLARSGILRLVVDTADEPSLREAELALREATGDPTLRLAYWVDEVHGFVNVRGKPFVIPEDTPTRVTTKIDYMGNPIAALLHDRALLDEPNLLAEVVGVVRMGLEKDRGERVLRATEIRNRAVLDAIPDLMFRVALDGRYLDYRAPSDYDLLVTEVVGKTVWDRLPRELADRIMAAGRRAIDEREIQTLEYQLDFHGEQRYFEGRVAASGEDEFLLIVRNITERKLQDQELQASRARIVAAGDEERRRLERNLHDGAQQRLVSLSLSLRLAQGQLKMNPEAAEDLLESAREELTQALEELRELARGIHPAILTDRGLPAALEALAARATVPVEIERGEADLPAPVEAAAYYVVSEALANVAKYANASCVRVSVTQRNGAARVEVADDGVGGADPVHGSGLRGLADRIAALDGTLEVESPPGGGTTIRAEIPLQVG